MTLTTEDVPVFKTSSPAPARQLTRSTRRRVLVPAVVLALAAATLLIVSVLTSDNTPTRTNSGRTVAEHGSIKAIDHRDELAMRGEAPAQTVAEHGSINAIDHRDELAMRGEDSGRTVAEHGGIKAIDHRDELAMRGEAPAQTVAEYGSINAIDHRDELAIAAKPDPDSRRVRQHQRHRPPRRAGADRPPRRRPLSQARVGVEPVSADSH